jgi:hypothetical protein
MHDPGNYLAEPPRPLFYGSTIGLLAVIGSLMILIAATIIGEVFGSRALIFAIVFGCIGFALILMACHMFALRLAHER